MNLAKRMIAVIGAPAMLAGVLLAGSASVHPTAAAPLQDTVTYTATVIIGGSHFTVNSTACRLKVKGKSGTFDCRVVGSGTLDEWGQPATADLTITNKFGPIALHIVNSEGCGSGTGLKIDKGSPVAVTAEATVDSTTEAGPNMLTVVGQIKVFDGVRNVCRDL